MGWKMGSKARMRREPSQNPASSPAKTAKPGKFCLTSGSIGRKLSRNRQCLLTDEAKIGDCMRIRLRKRENREKRAKTPENARKSKKDVAPKNAKMAKNRDFSRKTLQSEDLARLEALAKEVVAYAQERFAKTGQSNLKWSGTDDPFEAIVSYARGMWSVAVDFSMKAYRNNEAARNAYS